jgi:chromosomal replication initiator protein
MKVEEVGEQKLERSIEEIWGEAQSRLQKRVKTGTFSCWIVPAVLCRLENNEAVIAVAHEMHLTQISGSREVIAETLTEVSGIDVRADKVRFVIDASIKPQEYVASIASIQVSPPSSRATASGAGYATASAPAASADVTYQQEMRVKSSNLHAKNTIDRFVVGSHNRFCHSAAMAVADRPGETYNPLFIYGGVGLGKTHIMQAVGHLVMSKNPKASVLYVTCERFTNDLINSIRENKMIDFRKRYRQADVLLVDDIQFIEGKESTQEEFFHTFNTLRESGKQIILSSDRPPKDLPKLEERLRSRFEWGLIADIQPPDLETRLAILRKKSENERMIVSDAVLEYIASSFTSNIRELEGALLRAHAYTNLSGQPLNLQTAASVLQVGAPVSTKANLTVDNIIGAVANHYRVDTSDLKSAKRSKDLAWPRHVAMYLAHDILSVSHSRIGEFFGNRKHPSVIYAIDKIKEELPKNVQLSQAIQQIRRQLGI